MVRYWGANRVEVSSAFYRAAMIRWIESHVEEMVFIGRIPEVNVPESSRVR